MTANQRSWAITIALVCLIFAATLVIAGALLAARFEPDAREAAIRYLSERFHAEVQLQSLHIRLRQTSILRILLARGQGSRRASKARIFPMRLKSQLQAAPLFVI
jgi:hypothetical protein